MENDVRIVSNLKVVLAEKNMKLQTLSEISGISYSQLSKWINNNVQMSLDNVALICKILEITDINKILKIIKFEKKTLTDLKVS